MSLEIKDAAELGRIVQYHRKRARLSRAALSALAGTGTTVIYELEHGKPTVQFDVIRAILQTLNVRLFAEGPLMNEYIARSNETRRSPSER